MALGRGPRVVTQAVPLLRGYPISTKQKWAVMEFTEEIRNKRCIKIEPLIFYLYSRNKLHLCSSIATKHALTQEKGYPKPHIKQSWIF
jgi:hypothetical protein